MTPVQLLAKFRSQSGDKAVPPMWADDEIYGYMDEAQITFARLTDGIRDSVSSICSIVVTPTDTYTALDPRILRVFDAKDLTALRDYKIYNHTDPTVRGFSRTANLNYFVIGESENMLRAVDRPSANTTINLTVGRLPLTSIVDSTSSFEIRDEYVTYLIDGMFELAYLKDDADTYNRTRSESFGGRFKARCAEVKLELERRNYKPGLIAYGGL